MKIDFAQITETLQRFKAKPYKIYPVLTPHTGKILEFKVEEGSEVKGPSGKWLEKPGTPLFILEREKNPKIIRAQFDGVVQKIRLELLHRFVEAGVKVLEIKHPLSQEEIIAEILLKALYVVRAPETARYILTPELSKRLEKEGPGKVRCIEGEELLIMTFMKRETPIFLTEKGEYVLYQLYFKPFELIQAGEPLIGLCPVEDLPHLEKIIHRIKEEWSP
jgi:biotin carboxyl carrier protein